MGKKQLLNPATGEVIDLPAFPSVHAELGAQGMTLRDFFAAAALQGVLASMAGLEIDEKGDDVWLSAKLAYSIADEMLKERAK